MPDFMGIGAMRAGTSWLRKNLERHPGIWMATPKELHFFDRHVDERRWKLLSRDTDARLRYGLHFSKCPRDCLAGEITPAYAILPEEKIAVIKRWIPGLKIIYLLRDPVERAWSHARKDFATYWGKQIEEATLDDLRPFFTSPDVARRNDYLACLRTWLRHFEKENIHVAFLEDIEETPERILRQTFGFLGADDSVSLDAEEISAVQNPRPPLPIPEEVRDYLVESRERQDAELADLLGRRLPWVR